jgi:hypothetical protein
MVKSTSSLIVIQVRYSTEYLMKKAFSQGELRSPLPLAESKKLRLLDTLH